MCAKPHLPDLSEFQFSSKCWQLYATILARVVFFLFGFCFSKLHIYTVSEMPPQHAAFCWSRVHQEVGTVQFEWADVLFHFLALSKTLQRKAQGRFHTPYHTLPLSPLPAVSRVNTC